MGYDRKDKLYKKAKKEGLRSRAAYKLEELDRAHRFLRPGLRVVDVGCAPGSWLVAEARAVGPKGRVVGVDLLPCAAPGQPWATVIQGDAADPEVAARVAEALGGPADLVLSDAAPNLSGIRERDEAGVAAILRAVLTLAEKVLRPGGTLVAKTFPGEAPDAVERELRGLFKEVRRTRLSATRKTSSELYVAARGYRPPSG